MRVKTSFTDRGGRVGTRSRAASAGLAALTAATAAALLATPAASGEAADVRSERTSQTDLLGPGGPGEPVGPGVPATRSASECFDVVDVLLGYSSEDPQRLEYSGGISFVVEEVCGNATTAGEFEAVVYFDYNRNFIFDGPEIARPTGCYDDTLGDADFRDPASGDFQEVKLTDRLIAVYPLPALAPNAEFILPGPDTITFEDVCFPFRDPPAYVMVREAGARVESILGDGNPGSSSMRCRREGGEQIQLDEIPEYSWPFSGGGALAATRAPADCPDTPAADVPEGVLMTPVVADLDLDGNPDIVFVSSTSASPETQVPGRLRALLGNDWIGDARQAPTEIAYEAENNGECRVIFGHSQIAVGDLIPDTNGPGGASVPEIVAVNVIQSRLIVFRYTDDGTDLAGDPINPRLERVTLDVGQNGESELLEIVPTIGGPSIANVVVEEGPGIDWPEVVIGRQVFAMGETESGKAIFEGTNSPPNFPGFLPNGPGRGSNSTRGPLSFAVDIDPSDPASGAGQAEIVAGNVVWQLPAARTKLALEVKALAAELSDGWNAVADLDGDPDAEIVLVTEGFLYALDYDGTQVLAPLWGPTYEQSRYEISESEAGNGDELPESLGGPPAIGNIDFLRAGQDVQDDDLPEIVVAGGIVSEAIAAFADERATFSFDEDCPCASGLNADPSQQEFLLVFSAQGDLRWYWPISDSTEVRTPGVSLFDFEGDGNVEIVFRDESRLMILGADPLRSAAADTEPQLLDKYAEICVASSTLAEFPVVANIDGCGGDDRADIVVPSDCFNCAAADCIGLRVFEGSVSTGPDGDEFPFVETRSIWNQHPYSIVNIGDDATVPTPPEVNWAFPLDPDDAFNSFRQQELLQVTRGLPNFTVGGISITTIDVGGVPHGRICVQIGNGGAGVPVADPTVCGEPPSIEIPMEIWYFELEDPGATPTPANTRCLDRTVEVGFFDISKGFLDVCSEAIPLTEFFDPDDPEIVLVINDEPYAVSLDPSGDCPRERRFDECDLIDFEFPEESNSFDRERPEFEEFLSYIPHSDIEFSRTYWVPALHPGDVPLFGFTVTARNTSDEFWIAGPPKLRFCGQDRPDLEPIDTGAGAPAPTPVGGCWEWDVLDGLGRACSMAPLEERIVPLVFENPTYAPVSRDDFLNNLDIAGIDPTADFIRPGPNAFPVLSGVKPNLGRVASELRFLPVVDNDDPLPPAGCPAPSDEPSITVGAPFAPCPAGDEFCWTPTNAEEQSLVEDISLGATDAFGFTTSRVFDVFVLPAWTEETGAATSVVGARYTPDLAATWFESPNRENLLAALNPCPGDINNDRRTDISDLVGLMGGFGMTRDATRADGDANGDGAVDVRDFIVIANSFGCGG